MKIKQVEVRPIENNKEIPNINHGRIIINYF